VTAANETVYFRVSDAFGDFRPDLAYGASVSILPAQASLVFSSNPINFSGHFVEHSSPPMPIVIANAGSASTTLASLSPLAISGTNAADFTIGAGTTCVDALVLRAGDSCLVNITFLPREIGLRVATLSVLHSGSNSPDAVRLEGNGADFSISVAGTSSGSSTVIAGHTATYSLSLLSIGTEAGFPDSVSISVSGLPPGGSATLNPQSLSAGLPSSLCTLTVTTTSARALFPAARRGPDVKWLYLCTGLFAFTYLMLRRLTRRGVPTASLIVASALCAILASCSGGGGGTPTGDYVLKVTATSGPLSRSTDVVLMVR
jgi:hypothetical protein